MSAMPYCFKTAIGIGFILVSYFAVSAGFKRNREGTQTAKVAIIGAGIGGSSVAYFLKELQDVSNSGVSFNVDVFEKGDRIGGRLETVVINGKEYETGGSVLHPRNMHAVTVAKQLGLKKKEEDDSNEVAGIIRDSAVVLRTSPWLLVNLVKVLWRYGLASYQLGVLTTNLIDELSRVYKLQEEKVCFTNPTDLLGGPGSLLVNLTTISTRNFLVRAGYSEKFMNELVQAISYCNYGQTIDIHALVGFVSYAGSGSKLWSIKGGNKKLPEKMLGASSANFRNATVKSINYTAEGKYQLSIEPSQTEAESYDFVVIAAPMEVYPLDFINFKKIPYDRTKHKYHRTVATIIRGAINPNFILAKEKLTAAFMSDASTFFTSISELTPVDGTTQDETTCQADVPCLLVYKVFSPLPLTSSQLNIIFSEIVDVKVFDWRAYPHYDEIPAELPPFILDDHNLMYLNSIEWAASAMEMSLISGKNIALLIEKRMREMAVGTGATEPVAEGSDSRIQKEEL